MIHVQASGASDSDYHYIINTTRSEKAQWHNSKLPMQKKTTPKPQLMDELFIPGFQL